MIHVLSSLLVPTWLINLDLLSCVLSGLLVMIYIHMLVTYQSWFI